MRDVESLIGQVANPKVRQLVDDAWRCYSAGVNRAAIVSVWTAIITDITDKIVWLAEEGDGDANTFRTELRQAQQARLNSEISAIQTIESRLLREAEKFDLVEKTSMIDLDRVRHDRNRCVHTSLHHEDEVYEPTAETARAHLVTALTLLLTHPPLGGKRLFGRFIDYVCDPRFVLSEPHLLTTFHDRLRPRTRAQIFEVAAKHALLELPTDGWLPADQCADRMAKVLVLLASRDRERAREAAAKGMGRFAQLSANQKLRALARLGDQDFFWDTLPQDQHEHLTMLVDGLDVRQIDLGDRAAAGLLRMVAVLRALVGSEQARERLPVLEIKFNALTDQQKMRAATQRPARFFLPAVLTTLREAQNWDTGASAEHALIAHARFLDLDLLRSALQAWSGNDQCYNADTAPAAAVSLFHATEHLGRARIEVFGQFLTALPLDGDETPYCTFYAALAETLQANG
ncbi:MULTISPECIES: hypothetical protein [Actinosynnema]|uniref:hypothetical protein n=1 Tax=Actinosynnema TaxID=40566 RepID=UPI0020A2F791|nr:hypothetical protein [Actinosynnema pretiosum]MCP2097350.1 hypothetical protein [Actinosynnema pretiosum]